MTSAEFVAKYKLFKPIAERGARSFLAQEIQGHRAVLVHRLDIAPPDENRRLLGGLEVLRPEERTSVIEVADVDGVPIVVTRFTPDFHDLPSWLAQREQPGLAPRSAPQASSQLSPGGFTSVFSGSGLADVAPPPAATPRATPAPGSAPSALGPTSAAAPPSGPGASSGAGEFTQLFGAPLGRPSEPLLQPTQPAPSGQPIPPVQAPPAATAPVPGEFTQLFQGMPTAPRTAAAPQPPAPPPPRPDSSWPPAPPIRTAPPPPWAAAPPVSPVTPFGAAPPPASPPPADAPVRGEFTQLFQGFASPSASAPNAPQYPAPPPPPPSFGSASTPQTSSPAGFPPVPLPALGGEPSIMRGAEPPIMGPPGPPVFGQPPGPTMPPTAPPPTMMPPGAPPPLGGSFGAPPPLSGAFGAPPSPLGASFGTPGGPPPLVTGGGVPPMPPPVISGGLFDTPTTPPLAPPTAFSPSALPGAAPAGGSSAGPSEFTRMLGAIAPPRAPAAPPPLPVAPPPAASPAAGAQQAGGGSIKAYLPLILGLNVLLIAGATAVLYFLLKS